MDGVRLVRWRWRLRGAWQWPLFGALWPVNALVLDRFPFYGDGPGGFVPAMLLAGFASLFLVAVPAPLIGRLVRRRRPDLPRAIATDYAGAALLAGLTAALVLGGALHRPQVLQTREDRRAGFVAVHEYVVSQAPGYRENLAAADTVQLSDDLYRTCVPGPGDERPLCLYVETDQRPAGVRRDTEQVPNSAFR